MYEQFWSTLPPHVLDQKMWVLLYKEIIKGLLFLLDWPQHENTAHSKSTCTFSWTWTPFTRTLCTCKTCPITIPISCSTPVKLYSLSINGNSVKVINHFTEKQFLDSCGNLRSKNHGASTPFVLKLDDWKYAENCKQKFDFIPAQDIPTNLLILSKPLGFFLVGVKADISSPVELSSNPPHRIDVKRNKNGTRFFIVRIFCFFFSDTITSSLLAICKWLIFQF